MQIRLAFLPVLSRQRPSPHRRIGFAGSRPFNPVALSADRSFTPNCASRFRRKPIAAADAIQPQQARTRGEIPIAPAVPPPHTSRDFVPWRFSAAGHRNAWSGRRPGGRKPAHGRDIANASCHNEERTGWRIRLKPNELGNGGHQYSYDGTRKPSAGLVLSGAALIQNNSRGQQACRLLFL
jgi:hypothetical protein